MLTPGIAEFFNLFYKGYGNQLTSPGAPILQVSPLSPGNSDLSFPQNRVGFAKERRLADPVRGLKSVMGRGRFCQKVGPDRIEGICFLVKL